RRTFRAGGAEGAAEARGTVGTDMADEVGEAGDPVQAGPGKTEAAA
ncbi:AraC family transcriptional regulator, partial [Streptomyces griseoaurantiacus]|nr:AraC family transcriptional regulator [Streptomyces griseoaurantiacus]